MAPNFKHGKGAFFSMTSSTGGTINCSSGVDDSSLERTVETAEVTTYGDDDKVYLSGLRDATIPVAGHFAQKPTPRRQGILEARHRAPQTLRRARFAHGDALSGQSLSVS